MKILIFAGNSGSGGLKGYIKGFISGCIGREDQIYVICAPSLAEDLSLYTSTENINIIPMREATIGFWEILFGNKLPKSVCKRIDEISPDIVFYTNSIIHRGTERYVNALSFHNQLYVDNNQLSRMKYTKAWVTLLLHKCRVLSSLRNADICIFDSQQSYSQTNEYGIHTQKPIIAYFGVDASERVKDCRVSYSLHEPIKLLYISSFFAYKNQIELIKSISILRKSGYRIQLDLVGSGDQRYIEEVKKVINILSLNNIVILHSWVDHKKIKDMIDECDIYLYASSIETSGFGLMEGMVRGVPIACNNESCLPEVLQDSGLIFDIHSPQDTAKKIQNLIDNVSLREEYAKKALQLSSKYTWGNNVNTVFDAFQEYTGRV